MFRSFLIFPALPFNINSYLLKKCMFVKEENSSYDQSHHISVGTSHQDSWAHDTWPRDRQRESDRETETEREKEHEWGRVHEQERNEQMKKHI